jgi:PAS domain S-box-containing protein
MLNQSALIKIFDVNPLPSLLLLPGDQNFTIIEANAAYLKINGGKKDDLIGRNIFEVFDHTEDSYTRVISDMQNHLSKVSHSGKAHKMALSGHVLKGQNDPREHYWEAEDVPVLSDTGKTEYILHTLTDITAQKTYEYLFENNPSSMLVWDFETGRIVDSNAEAELKYGYTKDEFLTLHIRQIRPKEDIKLIDKATKNEEAYGLVHKRLWRHKKKNGEIMFMEVNARLIDYNGRRASINQSIDVTEKVKAEKELKDSQDRYRLLFYYSPLPIWTYDFNTYQILDVNEMAIAHYGYSRAEFLSMTIHDYRPEEDILTVTDKVKEVRDKYGVHHFGIFNHIKKDGTLIKAAVSGFQLTYQDKDCMLVVCNDVTEREAALEKLKENEIKLLTAQKIARLGYLDLNIDQQSLYWSDEVYNIWGVSKNSFKVSFDSFFETIHPDDKLNFSKAQELAFAGNGILDYGYRIVLPDGNVKWVHELGRIIKDINGTPIAFQGTVQDITSQKLLSLSLEESNKRFNYVTKATSDAIWDWDLISGNLYWGDGFQSIFGHNPAELYTDIRSWTVHLYPKDTNRVIKDMYAVINSTQSNWTNEYRFMKANGTYAYVADKGLVIRDETGKAIRIVGAMQDITRRKEEERHLKLLESVITHTNDAVLITEAEPFDEPGPKILYVNEAFTRMTGYPADEVIGKTPRILQGPNSNKEELKRLSAAIRNWQPCEITIINYKKNGEEFWIEFSVSPVADETGLYTHWIAIERDVTEKIKTEQTLKDAYKERNTILESIGDAFFAVDHNWVVTYWNNHAEKILLVAKPDIIGRNLWDVFPDRVDSLSYKNYHRAVENNQVIHFENYYESSNEWLEISAFPSGSGLSVYFKDIGDRKLVEQKINSERNLLRTLIDNLPHTVYFKDEFARKLISNKIDYEFLGVKSEDEVLGKTDLEVLPHDIASVAYDQDMEILNTGKLLINYEQYFTLDDDKPLWLSTTKLPLYNEKSEIIGLLGIGRDITERKIAEEKLKALNKELEKRIQELKQSEKKYSDLFHLNPQPMWVFDFHTLQFQDVNIAAINHYGYSRDEFLSMSIKNIIPADDWKIFEKNIKRLQNEERAFLNESHRHKKKNNEIIQVEVRGNVIIFKDKKSHIVVSNDITDRSNHINKIEEQNKLFREISWMQSHVIRAPLARTMGLIDLLKNHDMPPSDKDEALKHLLTSTNELDDLIKDISYKINNT